MERVTFYYEMNLVTNKYWNDFNKNNMINIILLFIYFKLSVVNNVTLHE